MGRRDIFIMLRVGIIIQHRIQRPGRGGQETWNLCGRLWQPSFLWLVSTGLGGGHGPLGPPPLDPLLRILKSVSQIYPSYVSLWVWFVLGKANGMNFTPMWPAADNRPTHNHCYFVTCQFIWQTSNLKYTTDLLINKVSMSSTLS